MKTFKLRLTATVFDIQTQEYVQRHVELPVSEEVISGLQAALNLEGPSQLRGFGHGDNFSKLPYKTPLASQKRFHIYPMLTLIEVEEKTGEQKSIDGFCGI